MEKRKIAELIELFKSSGLSSMEVNETNGEKSFSLKLENGQTVQTIQQIPVREAEVPAVQAPAPEDVKDFNKYRDIRSPMVGIFYAAPNPESEPFVKVGQKVKKGDTLCIIEAMKLMNDVVAEESGEIVEICAVLPAFPKASFPRSPDGYPRQDRKELSLSARLLYRLPCPAPARPDRQTEKLHVPLDSLHQFLRLSHHFVHNFFCRLLAAHHARNLTCEKTTFFRVAVFGGFTK